YPRSPRRRRRKWSTVASRSTRPWASPVCRASACESCCSTRAMSAVSVFSIRAKCASSAAIRSAAALWPSRAGSSKVLVRVMSPRRSCEGQSLARRGALAASPLPADRLVLPQGIAGLAAVPDQRDQRPRHRCRSRVHTPLAVEDPAGDEVVEIVLDGDQAVQLLAVPLAGGRVGGDLERLDLR